MKTINENVSFGIIPRTTVSNTILKRMGLFQYFHHMIHHISLYVNKLDPYC